MIFPHDYEYWMSYDASIIEHCDGLFRMKGESLGADREVRQAESLGIPIFDDVDFVKEWADRIR